MMTSAYSPPELFLRRLKKAFAGQPQSLREVARRVGMSPAYLSCLLKGQRNAPDNTLITKLEEVLNVQPPGSLFDAAGRQDHFVSKVLKKDSERLLMRSLAPLNAKDFAKVVELAELLAKKHQSKK
jgi:transcriptional regulator with XRE-family HTH domain